MGRGLLQWHVDLERALSLLVGSNCLHFYFSFKVEDG